MITHYGLFWSEQDVFWGRQKKRGELLGRVKEPLAKRGAPTKAERSKAQDFRTFIGLYCLYGDGQLIYVGEAGLGTNNSIFTRLKNHKKDSLAGSWDTFSWFGCENCAGTCNRKTSLKQLEAIAIAIVNPGFNKQSGTFSGASQVFQIPHEEAEGNLETKLVRMEERITELLNGKD